MSACDCLTKINAELAKQNTIVTPCFSLSGSDPGPRWPIATTQIQTGRGKQKAVALIAAHCPICGVALQGGAK